MSKVIKPRTTLPEDCKISKEFKFRASSLFDTRHKYFLVDSCEKDKVHAFCGKLNLPSFWAELTPNTQSFYICGVVLQGCGNVNQWITRLEIKTTTDGIAWKSEGVYQGCSDRNTRNFLVFKHPVLAKKIKLCNMKHHHHQCLRCALLVADSKFTRLLFRNLIREKCSIQQKENLVIKFSGSDIVLRIPRVNASVLSPYFADVIKKKNTKIELQKGQLSIARKIVEWCTKNNDESLSFKGIKELKDVFFLALEWKLSNLCYEIVKHLKTIKELTKIIDLLFELEESGQNRNQLFQQLKIILKRNFSKVISDFNIMKHLMSKNSKKVSAFYKYVMTKMSSDVLKDVKPPSRTLGKSIISLTAETKLTSPKLTTPEDFILFNDTAKDLCLTTNDKKVVSVHSPVLCKLKYFQDIGKGFKGKKTWFVDVHSKVLVIVLWFAYKKRFMLEEKGFQDKTILCGLTMNLLSNLHFLAEVIDLPELKAQVKDRFESYDLKGKELFMSKVSMHKMGFEIVQLKGKLSESQLEVEQLRSAFERSQLRVDKDLTDLRNLILEKTKNCKDI